MTITEGEKMKNKIWVILLCVSMIINIMLCYYVRNNKLELLYDKKELKSIVEGVYPNIVLIDLRESEDYESGHINGFINIPSDDGISVDEYLKKNKLEFKYIYLMCYSAKRAAVVADFLKTKQYFHVVYITFGYDEYVQSEKDFVPEMGKCDCLAE